MSKNLSDILENSYKRFIIKPYKNTMSRLRPKYPINQKRIEIEITTYCNLKCYNCNRSCRQAPSDEHMSLDQLRYFLAETVKYKKHWKELHLIGGEPTFHKDIFEICDLFLDYKKRYSSGTKVFVVTNGFGPKVNEVLLNLPEGIDVINSSKESPSQDFDTYNVAPIDIPEFRNKKVDFSAGCSVMEDCGMALSRYGYYCCGPGASVDRIFNFGIGIKDLSMVTENAMRQQAQILCRYCGLFKRRHRLTGQRKEEDGYTKNEQVSPSWEMAYKNYKHAKPELSLY